MVLNAAQALNKTTEHNKGLIASHPRETIEYSRPGSSVEIRVATVGFPSA